MNFRWQAHLVTSMWKLLSWIVSCGTWEDWDVPWCWILVSVLNETQMWVEGCECCFCEPRLQYKYSENTNTYQYKYIVNTNTLWIQIHREVWVLQRMGGLTHCGGGRQEGGGEDKEMSQEGDEGGCRWPAVATYLRKWYKYNCKKTVSLAIQMI